MNTTQTSWIQELQDPSDDFFKVYLDRFSTEEGIREGLCDAIKTLTPLLGWKEYLPHIPHGLLGLSYVLRLRPQMSHELFLQITATQLHYFAREGRSSNPLTRLKGSGSIDNIRLAIKKNLSDLALGEVMGIDEPTEDHFCSLIPLVAMDMANVGHKLVFVDAMRELFVALDRPKATGRWLLGISAWIAATPQDLFWADRARRRIDKDQTIETPSNQDHQAWVRIVCDSGLVNLLDQWSVLLKSKPPESTLSRILIAAACEKQMHARRDLESKTSWNFVYLDVLHRIPPQHRSFEVWCQAAALINMFPSEDTTDPFAHPAKTSFQPHALREAILDGDTTLALQAVVAGDHVEALWQSLVEASVENDPIFNYAHQLMMVGSGYSLAIHEKHRSQNILEAMAKSLSNSQGSMDLGMRFKSAFAAKTSKG